MLSLQDAKNRFSAVVEAALAGWGLTCHTMPALRSSSCPVYLYLQRLQHGPLLWSLEAWAGHLVL